MRLTQPRFKSFQEFADHIKGMDMESINILFRHEYEATEYVADLPLKKQRSDPICAYENALGMLLLYIRSGDLPVGLLEPQNAHVRKMIESIRADVESREPWRHGDFG